MTVTLTIEKRDKTSKASVHRRNGYIPATIYGPDIEPMSIRLETKTFNKVPYAEYTHLLNLEEKDKSGEPLEVLIKNIQKKHVSGEVLNIEFYRVKKGHKLTTKVMLKFVGNSEAVRMGADLVLIHKEANIRCLPRHIPDVLEVDISLLKEDEDHITFGDLNIPQELELLEPPAEIICKAETKKMDHSIEEEPVIAAAAEGEAAGAAAGGETAKTAESAPAGKAAS